MPRSNHPLAQTHSKLVKNLLAQFIPRQPWQSTQHCEGSKLELKRHTPTKLHLHPVCGQEKVPEEPDVTIASDSECGDASGKVQGHNVLGAECGARAVVPEENLGQGFDVEIPAKMEIGEK